MKSKIFRPATILIISIFIVAIITLLWVFRKSPESVGSSKPDITIDAQSIISDYEKNESNADAKYLDKIVLVSGTVESVTKNMNEITILLKEPNSMSGVICNFNQNSIELSTIKVGSIVSVKGVCNGYLMDVVLSKCVLNK